MQEREIVQEIPEIQVVGRSLVIEWRMVMARFEVLGPCPRGLATVAVSPLVFPDLYLFSSLSELRHPVHEHSTWSQCFNP